MIVNWSSFSRCRAQNRIRVIRLHHDGDAGQEEGRGGRREQAEDRDLRRHTAVHRGGRTLPVVPLHHPPALHLRLRLPLLRPVLHHPHTRGVLVLGARVRQLESHRFRKVSIYMAFLEWSSAIAVDFLFRWMFLKFIIGLLKFEILSHGSPW